jgi:hypothetical protein
VSVEQLGVLHIVKMNVGVDEVKSGHMVESLPGSILDLFFHECPVTGTPQYHK